MSRTGMELIIGLGLLLVTGCASIVSKSDWPVTVRSNPTGAKCVISKSSGLAVQTGETPMTVTLPSSDGYFSAAQYLVKCEKEGFSPAQRSLEAGINGWWYFGGNLIFGGVIGWFIVDPLTGAMYRLDEKFSVDLQPALPAPREGK